MASQAKKGSKVGRPRDPIPRVPLSLRVTPEIRMRLEELAGTSGRSISQEAELRLEQAFNREDLLPEVLTLAYDDRLAGLLMAVGETIKSIGPLRHASAQHQADGSVIVKLEKWDADERSKYQALKAARKLIELIASPDLIEQFEKNVDAGIKELGDAPTYSAVSLALMALKNDPSQAGDKRWKTIRSLLGSPFPEVT